MFEGIVDLLGLAEHSLLVVDTPAIGCSVRHYRSHRAMLLKTGSKPAYLWRLLRILSVSLLAIRLLPIMLLRAWALLLIIVSLIHDVSGSGDNGQYRTNGFRGVV